MSPPDRSDIICTSVESTSNYKLEEPTKSLINQRHSHILHQMKLLKIYRIPNNYLDMNIIKKQSMYTKSIKPANSFTSFNSPDGKTNQSLTNQSLTNQSLANQSLTNQTDRIQKRNQSLDDCFLCINQNNSHSCNYSSGSESVKEKYSDMLQISVKSSNFEVITTKCICPLILTNDNYTIPTGDQLIEQIFYADLFNPCFANNVNIHNNITVTTTFTS